MAVVFFSFWCSDEGAALRQLQGFFDGFFDLERGLVAHQNSQALVWAAAAAPVAGPAKAAAAAADGAVGLAAPFIAG